MNILLVNDDGYLAEGIQVLKKVASKYGRVVICAPKTEMSAKSCSITLGKEIPFKKVEEDVYYVEGTPADCANVGLTALGIDFDLVISGINNGFNISYDSLYSGTCGAALEALTHRVKAMAFSCLRNYDLVAKYFDQLFKFIMDNDLLSLDYFLNINFPIGDEVKGITLAKECYRLDVKYLIEMENGLYPYREVQPDFKGFEDTDCYLVYHGYISVVPLQKTLFSESLFDQLKAKIKI